MADQDDQGQAAMIGAVSLMEVLDLVAKHADKMPRPQGMNPHATPADLRWAWCSTIVAKLQALLLVESERIHGTPAEVQAQVSYTMLTMNIRRMRTEESLVQMAKAIIERPERADA